jgi:hypothetical protein
MPCYSAIQTNMIEIKSIMAAAQALGITITKVNENRYTLRKDHYTYIDIERSRPGAKFNTVAYSGSGDFAGEIISPLLPVYAKEQIKVWSKKNGYLLSPDKNPNEYVLTSLKG